MQDKEQLTEAAMRYLAQLEGDQPVRISDFVATVDADLRDELGPYLELLLAVGDVAAPAALSTEEQAIVDAAAQRIHKSPRSGSRHAAAHTHRRHARHTSSASMRWRDTPPPA